MKYFVTWVNGQRYEDHVHGNYIVDAESEEEAKRIVNRAIRSKEFVHRLMCTRAGSRIWRIKTLEQKILEDAQEIKEYTAQPLAFDNDWCDYRVDYSWTRVYPPRGFAGAMNPASPK